MLDREAAEDRRTLRAGTECAKSNKTRYNMR
jgi:hypothetical protein